jgi:hypothetical protein
MAAVRDVEGVVSWVRIGYVTASSTAPTILWSSITRVVVVGIAIDNPFLLNHAQFGFFIADRS